MKQLVFASFCVILGVYHAAALSRSRIVGGFHVSIDDVPYQVSVQRNGYHSSGGSIISPRWVLTAAHCTIWLDPKNYTILAGSADHTGGGGVVIQVLSLHLHPQFDEEHYDYDFSLLELTESVGFSRSIAAVPLPEADETVADGVMCTVSGWGDTLTSSESRDSLLRAVNVPTYNQEECAKVLTNVHPVTKQMICAGYAAGGKDACRGDSGGPLVAGGKLVGVVSWGDECALPNSPGVYARVSSVREWIQKVSKV